MTTTTDARRAMVRVGGLSLLAVLLALLVALPVTATAGDEREYLSQREFLAGAFPGASPRAEKLRIDPSLRERLAAIYRHPFRADTLRYWRHDARSAWLIDEIGKEKPITIGVVVDQARIVTIAVLVYREGHGMEVADDRFTRQFAGAGLVERDQRPDLLDRGIDNITGATLSVRAMTRTARAALLLDAWLRGQAPATGAATPPRT